VTVLDLGQGEAVAEIFTWRGGEGIDVTPDGRTVWIANMETNSVLVIDTNTLTVVDKLRGRGRPTCVKITPDGRTALVGYDHAPSYSGAVVGFDVTTRHESWSANTGRAIGLAIHPLGQTAYVVKPDSDSVLLLDLRQQALVGTVAVGPSPSGLVIAVPWLDGQPRPSPLPQTTLNPVIDR
jgi:YVTN family beta-propeller protein